MFRLIVLTILGRPWTQSSPGTSRMRPQCSWCSCLGNAPVCRYRVLEKARLETTDINIWREIKCLFKCCTFAVPKVWNTLGDFIRYLIITQRWFTV
jgi:hypothetical protein